jgi:hypothetical protein
MANPATDAPESHTIKPKKSGRVISIDAFRGFCLTVMIFANYGGGI